MDKRQTGMLEMVIGAILAIGGLLGFIFGRNAKTATLRIVVYVISGLAVVSGLWLFVLGMDDYAMGIMGQMTLTDGETPKVTAMVAVNPIDLQIRLKATFAQMQSAKTPVRRLHFICPDLSKDVTVYNTPLGIWGVPKQDIVCNDGMELVKYGQ